MSLYQQREEGNISWASVHLEPGGFTDFAREPAGNKVGYRIGGGLQDELALQPPDLTANVERLYTDLETPEFKNVLCVMRVCKLKFIPPIEAS